jgi:hypothetical protein
MGTHWSRHHLFRLTPEDAARLTKAQISHRRRREQKRQSGLLGPLSLPRPNGGASVRQQAGRRTMWPTQSVLAATSSSGGRSLSATTALAACQGGILAARTAAGTPDCSCYSASRTRRRGLSNSDISPGFPRPGPPPPGARAPLHGFCVPARDSKTAKPARPTLGPHAPPGAENRIRCHSRLALSPSQKRGSGLACWPATARSR